MHAQGARDDGLLVGVDLEHAHLVGERERERWGQGEGEGEGEGG